MSKVLYAYCVEYRPYREQRKAISGCVSMDHPISTKEIFDALHNHLATSKGWDPELMLLKSLTRLN